MGVLRIITVGGIGYAAFRAWQRRQSSRGLSASEDASGQSDVATSSAPVRDDAEHDLDAALHTGADAALDTRVDDGSRTPPRGDPLTAAPGPSPV
ncbi:MAG TPA: hypothetical protein VLK29_06310 [Luteimonas sp.]|nr:hypothetical protein [Luteimonas sp.]